MNTTTALFYVFSAVLLFAAFRVITARTAVHSALYLVLAFFTASCRDPAQGRVPRDLAVLATWAR
jgi:NADH:ubiquinone oxidoreductase subunit 6 (subunit J)